MRHHARQKRVHTGVVGRRGSVGYDPNGHALLMERLTPIFLLFPSLRESRY